MPIENRSRGVPERKPDEPPLSSATFTDILGATARIASRGRESSAKWFGRFKGAVEQGLDNETIMGKSVHHY